MTSVSVRIADDGRGTVLRHAQPSEGERSRLLVSADSIPELVTDIRQLAIDGRITPAEREQLLDDVEAEVGYAIREAS